MTRAAVVVRPAVVATRVSAVLAPEVKAEAVTELSAKLYMIRPRSAAVTSRSWSRSMFSPVSVRTLVVGEYAYVGQICFILCYSLSS